MSRYYNLCKMISELSQLQTGVVYPYASISAKTQGECTLVAVDQSTSAVSFRRAGDAKDQQIKADKLKLLADALSERIPVEINALYGGGGNFRSALEALVARTPNVFLCEINGKKHIFWDPNQKHASGDITVGIPPKGVISTSQVREAIQLLKTLDVQFDEVTTYTHRVWVSEVEKKLGVLNLEDEFRCWLSNVYKKPDGAPIAQTAISSYVNSLLYLTDAKAYPGQYDHNSSSYWYNMYHYLYGVDGASVYSYETKADVLNAVGAIYTAITEGDAPDGVNVDHFNNVRLWSQQADVKKASWIFCSFQKYFEFLEWRQRQREEDRREIDSVDCLSTALKLFRRGRAEKGLDGWASFDAWAKEARAQFAKADAAMFAEADFDYAGFMRRFVYNPTVANNSFKNHTLAEKAAVGNFISQNRQSPQAVSWYLNPANRPTAAGMGVGVMLNFMMKVRPAEFATYSSMLDKMLVFTGIAKAPSPQEITVEGYEANKALQGQVLAKMHELGIGKAADDNSPADYLTVNEFAWWLSDEKNQNLVKEEIMSKQMKKPNDACEVDSDKSIVDELNDKTDSMMARLTASLLTKPFVILAGASGTGKSRMVKKLAYMTCRADMLRNPHDETPGNYCMIAVKPNWHDSSELLGYKSAFAGHEYVSSDFVKFILKAFAFPHTPFFVCLDEMNLAPVEQYFAEYLSAVESAGKNKNGEWMSDPLIQRGEFGGDVLNLAPEYELPAGIKNAINEKGLFIPQNLFVVGTVNMDDTTNQFSRKVLDRAMTIMMNEVDFDRLKGSAYEKLTNDLRIKNDEIAKFIDRAVFDGAMLDEGFEMLLNGIKGTLIDSPFEIGYRFAIETALYREALGFLTGKATKGEDESATAERKELSLIAIDHLVLMKVLPRIIGTLAERDVVLKELKAFLGSLGAHQVSAAMLERMTKFAANNGGYISFWP